MTRDETCDLCGQPMVLDARDPSEWADDDECGIPRQQWACFCNGGNYKPFEDPGTRGDQEQTA